MNEQNKNHYLIIACISFLMGYFSYNLIFAKDLNYWETKQITNTSIQIGSWESKIQKDWSWLQRISNPVQWDMKETWYIVHNATTKLSKETKTDWWDRLTKKITHKWFSSWDIKQQYVNYAYKLWGMDLVLLMECENGTWNIDTRWDNGNAYWLCQMNKIYNYIPEWYYDTRQIQVEYCAEKMRNWTPFYGPSRKIKWVKCYQYVKDRFYITNI